MVLVRDYTHDDWPQVWPIIERVVRDGDTFPYPRDLAHDEAEAYWVENGPVGRVSVAVDDGVVLGTARMGRNRPGPGSHVATASYMVSAAARARGVGRALVSDSLAWARESGYLAMQFNAVLANNVHAVRLYEAMGFAIVGTVPDAHEMPDGTFVDAHVMHVRL